MRAPDPFVPSGMVRVETGPPRAPPRWDKAERRLAVLEADGPGFPCGVKLTNDVLCTQYDIQLR